MNHSTDEEQGPAPGALASSELLRSGRRTRSAIRPHGRPVPELPSVTIPAPGSRAPTRLIDRPFRRHMTASSWSRLVVMRRVAWDAGPGPGMPGTGGGACADVRWVCRDIGGCTERWASRTARVTGTTSVPKQGRRSGWLTRPASAGAGGEHKPGCGYRGFVPVPQWRIDGTGSGTLPAGPRATDLPVGAYGVAEGAGCRRRRGSARLAHGADDRGDESADAGHGDGAAGQLGAGEQHEPLGTDLDRVR